MNKKFNKILKSVFNNNHDDDDEKLNNNEIEEQNNKGIDENEYTESYKIFANVIGTKINRVSEKLPVTSDKLPSIKTNYILQLAFKLDTNKNEYKDIMISKQTFDEINEIKHNIAINSKFGDYDYFISTKILCKVNSETKEIEEILDVEILSLDNVLLK